MTQPETKTAFTSYQKIMIAILAFLQFTVILDFMIMSPLGALIMPALKMSTQQFGSAVSAYAFSAAIAGFLAAGFADRYDRKKLLMIFYCGFIFGTLLCGLATSYEFLLSARIVAGLFGGVLGSVILAIIADLFKFEIRGRAMAIIQTAFAASQVLGLPAGIYFSNHWGWHAPFMIIVALGSLAGVGILFAVKPITEHLNNKTDLHPFHHLWITLKSSRHQLAFAATGLLSVGGFMIMPFASVFTNKNLGIPLTDLPIIYLSTGLATILIAPMVGRISEKIGYFRTFAFGSLLSLVTVIAYTHLGASPLPLVIAVNIVMFIGIFSRMIPAQTLTSAVPSPQNRGAFMALNSSLQQMAGGLAAVIAGAIVSQDEAGKLLHFEVVGYVMVATTLITMSLIYLVDQMIKKERIAK